MSSAVLSRESPFSLSHESASAAPAKGLGHVSLDHLDSRVVSRCLGQRRVAGDDGRIECFRQGDVHGVRRDFLTQSFITQGN